MMDEFKLFNRALSAAEVASLASAYCTDRGDDGRMADEACPVSCVACPEQAGLAGLDEGLLSLCLPILACMENPYRKTNDSDE